MYRLSLLVVIASFLSACASQSISTVAPTAIPTAIETVCQPSEIMLSNDVPPEIKGSMKSDGELWALLFFDKPRANQEAKIVWRITGEEGEFHALAENEAGTVILPLWTTFHESSTWERPGTEWGTGFNFPEAGCWRITVSRGETVGEIALDVIRQ